MSYKSKKKRKKLIERLRYRSRRFRIVLSKLWSKSKEKESRMYLPQTRAIMCELRARAARIRTNNKKIEGWVDEYVNNCILNGRAVEILTQWCLSKDLEERREAQGGKLEPLERETRLIKKEIPEIIEAFTRNGVRVSWWFTLNGAFLDRGRVSKEVREEYLAMIEELISQVSSLSKCAIVIDWEKEILGGERPGPNNEVLERFEELVDQNAFGRDFENLLRRVRKYPDFKKSEPELQEEARFKIACEAEEGRFLVGDESLFPRGEFILTPLEFPERYIFFETLVPGFQKRVAAVLKPYPWRMDSDTLSYEG